MAGSLAARIADGRSLGCTSDSTALKKYQQSLAALCFVGLRFWERDG